MARSRNAPWDLADRLILERFGVAPAAYQGGRGLHPLNTLHTALIRRFGFDKVKHVEPDELYKAVAVVKAQGPQPIVSIEDLLGDDFGYPKPAGAVASQADGGCGSQETG